MIAKQQTKVQVIEYVTQMAAELAKMADSNEEKLLATLLQVCAKEGRQILRSGVKQAKI